METSKKSAVLSGLPKLRYNERLCQTPLVHYIAKFTISNMGKKPTSIIQNVFPLIIF